MEGRFSTSTTKLIHKSQKICTKYFIAVSAAAILLLIITLALVIALASRGKSCKESVIASQQAGSESDVCLTAACAQAASKMIDSLDTTVDPCDDFYQYSCGGWIDKTVIPESEISYSKFSELRDKTAVLISDLLLEENLASDTKTMLEAKDMYKACVNNDKKEEVGIAPLRQLHTDLGGWPMTDPTWNETEFDLLYTLSELSLLGNKHLVDVSVSADEKDSKVNIVKLDQFIYALPHKNYYTEPEFAKERNAYKTHIREVAMVMGADNKTVDKDVNDIFEFETYFANISTKPEDRGVLPYHSAKVSDLTTKLSDKFEWKKFLNLLFVDTEFKFTDDTDLVVHAPEFLTKMAEKVAVTSPRVLANYLVWRITEYKIIYLNQELQDSQNKYWRVAYSVQHKPPIWRNCVNYLDLVGLWAIGRSFADKYFKEESKIAMEDMTSDVREAFDVSMSNTDWMDSQTKLLAKEKLAAMNNDIGFPDWIHNDTAMNLVYEGLEFDADTFFHNNLNWLKWRQLNEFKQITEPVRKDRWPAGPADLTASYHPELNTMVLPAGALQPPFYHKQQPMSLNYGGMGSFIGHAITHGFDNTGRLYDKDGNIGGQWWDDKTEASFTEKTKCMIDQYSSYTLEEINQNVNGKNTLPENIADNAAIKTSYAAFLKHEEKNGPGQRLPGLMQYNSKQLFFLNFAQMYCRVDRASVLKYQVAGGSYRKQAPGKWRVIGPLSNNEEFSKVFGCPVGSVMNPEKKCPVW